MEPFVLKSLKKLRKEAPRRYKELRTVCDELTAALSDSSKAEGGEDGDQNAHKYFDPLQTACRTKHPKLMEIALDAIHYLLEHGYLNGGQKIVVESVTSGDDEIKLTTTTTTTKTLVDVIVETVAKCSEEYDDTVHVQVIKLLLLTLTSKTFEVHEASLLLAVRSCFHIHLVSKNPANKTTAKAALTQIMSTVFNRMEAKDAELVRNNEPHGSVENVQMEVSPLVASVQNLAADTKSFDSKPFDGKSFISSKAGKKEADESKDDEDDADDKEGEGGVKESKPAQVFPSVFHKDAFLIFRALCKLSMKGLQDETGGSPSDPIALQNKILSLEMILHILQRCGPGFRSGERYIYAIKQYLCVSLLGNCTSSVNQVTGLALHVFVALLDGFTEHLKAELEVFVTNIFLSILSSENSTFEHKSRVLEVFHNICGDPNGQVELFINYDCDFESIDLFRRIVDAFSKISKNPTFFLPRTADFLSSKKSISEEHTIRHLGLEGLVIILRSLVKSSGIGLPKEKTKDTPPSPHKARSSIDGVNIAALRGETFDDDTSASVHMSAVTEEEEAEHIDDVVIQASNSMESIRLDDEDDKSLMKSYDRKHRIREEIENGILKFNLSPKKGLKYLSSLGHIENTPVGIATFFHQYGEKLDKTAIGEYLGREKEYEGGMCTKVLHEYVDAMSFAGMHFDEAIRLFLSGFRLPGEAQKIDRMMEKFAERYYIANKTVFASADMAFILAFSTIMLQTNLHNPAIKDDKRMTKDQFIKQNKGISSDGELPESMLMDIYDRIQATPISLNQDERNRKVKKDDQSFFASMSQDKRRKDAFNDERKEMVRSSEALFKARGKSKVVDKSIFKHADQSYEAYARPMFEVAWAPMISVFSQIIEMVDDYDLIALCLEGFRLSIRLSSRLDVVVARDTYVNALLKFTTLDSVKEMRFKHIDAIKLLINVALTDGDFLFESWGQILRGLSNLSRLQLFGNRVHSDDLFFADQSSSSKDSRGSGGKKRPSSYNVQNMEMSGMDQFTKLFTGPSRAETARLIEENNAELIMREIDPVMVDRIFINSQNLSSESVLHFVDNLCAISLEEISTTTNNSLSCLRGKESGDNSMAPRVFSLQKLVEVADFNMHVRPRLSWTKLWSVLAAHFSAVGVDDNHALSMFAIDSLKQLSIKFLQKDELSNFNFQRLFLKPFEVIMVKSQSAEIKELILRCLDIMVLACAPNIHSGWRSLFAVFCVAAAYPKADIAGIAFEITERLMTQQFNLLVFDFVELMNCLVAFVAGPHSFISLAALSHISQCADHLAQGSVTAAIDNQHTSSDAMGISWESSNHNMQPEHIGEDASVFRLWWPLLLGLSTRVADPRLVIRTRAVETLHQVLSKYGHMFSPQIWEVIFKGVLFPIMDSAKTDNTLQPKSLWPKHNPMITKDPASWIATSAATVLDVSLQLFDQHYEGGLSSPFVADVMSMLQGCIGQDIESLARMGLSSLRTLIVGLRHDAPSNAKEGEELRLSPDLADLVCERLCDVTLSNLCMDFGGHTSVLLDADTAPIVVDLVHKWKGSPLGSVTRKNNRNMVIEESDFDVKTIAVDTPFGVGKVVKSVGKDTNAKHTIILSWGATLYTYEKFPTADVEVAERSMLTPQLNDEQRWLSLSCEAMTSMVLSLDIIDVMGDVLSAHYNSFSVSHFEQMLGVLQASYDHARCFNADDELRALLRGRNFMRFGDNSARLPHLLEQETKAACQLLAFVLRLYAEENSTSADADGKAKAALAEPIFKRISCKILERYLLIDELSLTSRDFFVDEQLAIYAPPVMLALNGIASFGTEQFARNIPWILPLLANMSICNNRKVRSCVKQVYESQVNTILM